MHAKKLIGKTAIRTVPNGKDFSYMDCPVLIKSVNEDGTITVNNGFCDHILSSSWDDNKWKSYLGVKS